MAERGKMADKVLVVDDEKLIVKGIKYSLEQDGMEVSCAYDGREALDLIKANNYDIILLDVMLPEMDGYTVCQQVREFSDVPIIMITAKSEDMDKILGLDYGADVAGNRVMDRNNRHVYIKGKEISLTTKEYDVLELLVTNPNKVYGREMLLSLIWGYDYPGDARTVDVHIRRLREKIESNPSEPEYVHTKWGMGYFFKQ